MRHIIIFVIGIGLCTILLLLTPFYSQGDKGAVPPVSFDQQPQLQDNSQTHEKNILCKYYDEEDFFQSINSAQDIAVPSKEIIGGIVPHHLLAREMIATFFKTLSIEQPEVVVVIAPNHKGTGVKKVHTGNWNWQTPFGVLEADQETVDSLIDSKTADMDFDLLEGDHSISGLIPYIKYYMPNSKIVPVLLHGSYGLKDAQQLGKNLQEKLKNNKTLFLASVDFSHYLSLEKADQMDKISIKAIKNKDIQLIQHFNNDYMDSPASIITLISVMTEAGANHMGILEHTNSDRINNVRSNNTTSYFTTIFYSN